MTKNQKTLVGVAAVGIILYELWKRQHPTGIEAGIMTDPLSPVPVWAQQLSQTGGTTTSIIDDLMSIPQGPGGSASAFSNVNFFSNPECILPVA